MENGVTGLPTSKQGRNKLAIVLGAFLLIALVGCGVLGYLSLNRADEANRLQATVDTNSRTIETLKTEINDTNDTKKDTEATEPTHPVEDDSTLIVTTVGAYAHTRVNDEHAKLSIKMTKKELPFARVSVSGEEGTGYACVLKKSDGIWIVLFCGQGVPMQSDLDQWGVPNSILSVQ